jgi:hypothetical protein
MPPVSIVSMIAIARTPISDIWNPIERKFCRVGNRSGRRTLRIARMDIVMTSRRSVLPSSPVRSRCKRFNFFTGFAAPAFGSMSVVWFVIRIRTPR